MYYVIRIYHDDPSLLFWNNEDGATDLYDATVFTEEEKEQFNLPFGGEWIELPSIPK